MRPLNERTMADWQTTPVETWIQTLSQQPAPESAEIAAAACIIGDLRGYRQGNRFQDSDVRDLANALTAYARMLHTAGVTP
jgi:hypothetical protein